MRTTDAGDDKDRVLIRSNGELTYFASDTAYYLDKRGRGFDVCIYLLGADHHGYVRRMHGDVRRASVTTPGKNLEILIGQMVNLVRDGSAADVQARWDVW